MSKGCTEMYSLFMYIEQFFLKFTWISQLDEIKTGKQKLQQNTDLEILDGRFLLDGGDSMTVYEALSLMIGFGLLVATIILGCK